MSVSWEDADDDALLAGLAAVLRGRMDPPRDVVEASKGLFTWRTMDAELAALTFDSLLDEPSTRVRGPGEPRVLVFDSPALSIEMEIETTTEGRRLLGQLLPPQSAELELSAGGETISGQADDFGRFTMTLPSTDRPVSLRCRLADGAVVCAANTTF